jgi:ABC-type spermidine/putrescine transport system permease subunit II
VSAPAVTASAPAAPRARRLVDVPGVLLRSWTFLTFLFLYIPILFVVLYSFNSGRFLLIWRGFGTNWYSAALENRSITTTLSTSLLVAALTTAVSIVLGTLAGIALARRGGGWVRPFLLIIFLILVTPEIVNGISYLIFFVRANLDSGLVRLVIGHSIYNSAVITLIVHARLAGLDESLEEAAADLGAPPGRAFRQVTLPLMLPAVIAGGLLSFTLSLDDVIISTFLSTAGTSTLPVYIFSSLRTGLKGDVAAISTLMLLVTFAALAAAVLVLRRSGESAEGVAQTLTGTKTMGRAS